MKKLTVIGIGKLGLCFSLTLERSGFDVIGVDLNQDYVDSINNKTLKSTEQNVEDYLSATKNFTATTSLSRAVELSDILFVVVATLLFVAQQCQVILIQYKSSLVHLATL